MCRAVSDDAPFPPRQFKGRFRASASPQLVICRRAQPGKLVQERHQHIASLEQRTPYNRDWGRVHCDQGPIKT